MELIYSRIQRRLLWPLQLRTISMKRKIKRQKHGKLSKYEANHFELLFMKLIDL